MALPDMIARRLEMPHGESGCWLWTGSASGGYPKTRIGGRAVAVRRVVYEQLLGQISSGHDLNRLCPNQLCVNPEHAAVVRHATYCRRRGTQSLAERMERFIEVIPDLPGCWLWIGARCGSGYGSVAVGRRNGTAMAHRAMYELAKGPIPAGFVLDHLCGLKICVNPDHLRPVPQRDNVMRGSSIPALNASKAVCTNGHQFDEANTYQSKAGRACRACHRSRERERKRRISLERPS